MKIEIKKEANYIMGCIPKQSGVDDVNKWTEIIQEVLKYSFDGLRVYLFTLAPQKYSLGYELGSYVESKAGKEKVLINSFERCSDNQIYEIAKSEEFSRGLLKIALSRSQKSFGDISFVDGDYSNLKDELITCEDDGYSFYWFNPHLSKEDIEQRFEKIISLHMISN
ncbi:MAG: hypothetical protein O9262_13750 [Cyclobacteriaceae bacterium]|nr:hypothetical protein [Cyclobacteriaceae bacterium]